MLDQKGRALATVVAFAIAPGCILATPDDFAWLVSDCDSDIQARLESVLDDEYVGAESGQLVAPYMDPEDLRQSTPVSAGETQKYWMRTVPESASDVGVARVVLSILGADGELTTVFYEVELFQDSQGRWNTGEVVVSGDLCPL